MTSSIIPTPELIGALGDLMWATFVPPSDLVHPRPVDIMVLHGDDELLLHRLLLAGYKKLRDDQRGHSIWVSPNGKQIRVLEEDSDWSREAIMVATRNRDIMGAPHFTLPYAILERCYRLQESGAEARLLLANATPDELMEFRTILARLAPELECIVQDLID